MVMERGGSHRTALHVVGWCVLHIETQGHHCRRCRCPPPPPYPPLPADMWTHATYWKGEFATGMMPQLKANGNEDLLQTIRCALEDIDGVGLMGWAGPGLQQLPQRALLPTCVQPNTHCFSLSLCNGSIGDNYGRASASPLDHQRPASVLHPGPLLRANFLCSPTLDCAGPATWCRTACRPWPPSPPTTSNRSTSLVRGALREAGKTPRAAGPVLQRGTKGRPRWALPNAICRSSTSPYPSTLPLRPGLETSGVHPLVHRRHSGLRGAEWQRDRCAHRVTGRLACPPLSHCMLRVDAMPRPGISILLLTNILNMAPPPNTCAAPAHRSTRRRCGRRPTPRATPPLSASSPWRPCSL